MENRIRHSCLILTFAMLLAACSPSVVQTPTPSMTASAASRSSSATATRVSAVTPTAGHSATPTLAPMPQVCSPLHDYTLAQIPGMVTNPYHPPPPGSDNPHEGIDISVLRPGSQVALAGQTVQAALDGVIAAAIRDRFPYGNALIVETPLFELPAAWVEPLRLPTLAPTLPFNGPLTCPRVDLHPSWGALTQRSLYVVYAHMQDRPALQSGDTVSCGQPLGKVGESGNALNPHLHFEARIGPSGARFDSLAHYDVSATPAEMAAYCTWRVSNLFQLLDPLRVLAR